MRRLLGLVLAPLLLTAACAQPGISYPSGDDPSGGPTGPLQSGDVVLRYESVGGFVPAQYLITRLPEVTVYGDGRVITEGPTIEIYPGPALPNILVRQLTEAGVGELVRLALEAGVGRTGDLGTPSVADVPSTRITVLTDDGIRQTEVYALGFDHGITAEQRAARAKLQEFVDKLGNLPATLGAANVQDEQPYEPVVLAAIAKPYFEQSTDLPAQEPKAWPGPALPGPPIPGAPPIELGCVAVTGLDLPAVLAAAQTANTLTPWESGGQRYAVSFRPLLPDESACADLVE